MPIVPPTSQLRYVCIYSALEMWVYEGQCIKHMNSLGVEVNNITLEARGMYMYMYFNSSYKINYFNFFSVN